MDAIDRRILNRLQDGFPISEHPFADTASDLDIEEGELMQRLEALLAAKTLTRLGPLFNAERLGGGVTLAALEVPRERFDEVAALINAHPEVAHNYERDHRLNMWFVIAADREERIGEVIAQIEAETGLSVLNMPKLAEFFVGLRFEL